MSDQVTSPRVWHMAEKSNPREHLWFQSSPHHPVLHVEMRALATVNESTFRPDQLSGKVVEAKEAQAALAAKEAK